MSISRFSNFLFHIWNLTAGLKQRTNCCLKNKWKLAFSGFSGLCICPQALTEYFLRTIILMLTIILIIILNIIQILITFTFCNQPLVSQQLVVSVFPRKKTFPTFFGLSPFPCQRFDTQPKNLVWLLTQMACIRKEILVSRHWRILPLSCCALWESVRSVTLLARMSM